MIWIWSETSSLPLELNIILCGISANRSFVQFDLKIDMVPSTMMIDYPCRPMLHSMIFTLRQLCPNPPNMLHSMILSLRFSPSRSSPYAVPATKIKIEKRCDEAQTMKNVKLNIMWCSIVCVGFPPCRTILDQMMLDQTDYHGGPKHPAQHDIRISVDSA